LLVGRGHARPVSRPVLAVDQSALRDGEVNGGSQQNGQMETKLMLLSLLAMSLADDVIIQQQQQQQQQQRKKRLRRRLVRVDQHQQQQPSYGLTHWLPLSQDPPKIQLTTPITLIETKPEVSKLFHVFIASTSVLVSVHLFIRGQIGILVSFSIKSGSRSQGKRLSSRGYGAKIGQRRWQIEVRQMVKAKFGNIILSRSQNRRLHLRLRLAEKQLRNGQRTTTVSSSTTTATTTMSAMSNGEDDMRIMNLAMR